MADETTPETPPRQRARGQGLRGAAARNAAQAEPSAKPRVRVPAGSSPRPRVRVLAGSSPAAPATAPATAPVGPPTGPPPEGPGRALAPSPGERLPATQGGREVAARPSGAAAVAPSTPSAVTTTRAPIPLSLPSQAAPVLGRVARGAIGRASGPLSFLMPDNNSPNSEEERELLRQARIDAMDPQQDYNPSLRGVTAPNTARATNVPSTPERRRPVSGSTGRPRGLSEADRLNDAMLSVIDPQRFPVRSSADVEKVRALRQTVADKSNEGYAGGGMVGSKDGRAIRGKTKGRFI